MNKKTIQYLILLMMLQTSCSDKSAVNGLPYIDAGKNYPEREIILTDIAEVTYLYLNSDDDDYLYSGSINYITENTVVVYDDVSGSVLFFSKDGMPKSRFNRRGQGPEEYIRAFRLFYDEAADDVYIMDNRGVHIQVYSSTGMYKKKITLPQGMMAMNDIVSFDESSFLFHDVNTIIKRVNAEYENLSKEDWISTFYRISKVDGSVLDYFELPMLPIILAINYEGMRVFPRAKYYILKNKEGALVGNPESDTVFLYRKNQPLLPVIYKTPSVASTDPMTYLNNCVDVGSYQFMEIFTMSLGFPVKHYMRDKKTGEIFRQKLLLPDYKGKEVFIAPSVTGRNYENGIYFELDLYELKEADRENKLSGKLKELVDTLNEDEDNNVFLLVNFK